MADPIATFIASLTALSAGFSSMPAPSSAVLPGANQHILVSRPADAQRIADRSRIISILQGNNVTPGGQAQMLVYPNLSVSGSDSCNRFNGTLTVSEQGSITMDSVTTTDMACDSPADEEFWQVAGQPMVMFVDDANRIYLTNGVQNLALVKQV